ncbi:MAG: hypothetical protein ACLQF0_05620 [Dissulfurispiraceae bacterium]
MFSSYEKITGVNYKGFRSADRAIATLHKELHAIAKVVGNLPSYLCRMAGVDIEYYRWWIESGNLLDLAELIVLYLRDEERETVLAKLGECKAICC